VSGKDPWSSPSSFDPGFAVVNVGQVKEIHKPESKKDWTLSQAGFSSFLGWLDQGSDSGGESYLEMRRRLVSYFDRKNCRLPDELADETLNRVARRLEEEGSITDTTPAHYCYIVAKFVFLEYLRRQERGQVSLDELSSSSGAEPAAASSSRDEIDREERRLDCLDRCLRSLEKPNRELIVEYYRGEQRTKIEARRGLAERFGITANALSIRACRIRGRLEDCVGECMNRVRERL
jgi:DNA-directed RNA polymerase specialized sigma24 family protein